MRVLSLFDGMSCGQIALRELGIIPEVYYASEINKCAIEQTQLNFPKTVQLGDVCRWREWNVDWSSIDAIFAGSPCQGFSIMGKQLAFDDPRSVLFFVFVEILNHCRKFNPDVLFILENVNMRKAYLGIISKFCGLFPVRINSVLVSAQNRDRYYWSNIRTRTGGLFNEVFTDIPQPAERNIHLADIIEDNVPETYNLSEKQIAYITSPMRLKKKYTAIDGEKSLPLMANNRNSCTGTFIRVYNMLPQSSKSKRGGTGQLVREDGKVYCLNAQSDVNAIQRGGGRIRFLTPRERLRLQTVPEWYIVNCSDAQVSEITGNGWTVEVIKHILSFLPQKFLSNGKSKTIYRQRPYDAEMAKRVFQDEKLRGAQVV